jgi:WD40 repeat protein
VVGALQVWDLRTGREVLTRTSTTGRFQGLAFSPDGRRIAYSYSEPSPPVALSRLTVRDLDAGTDLFSLAVDGYANPLTFSPDGRRLAGVVYAWYRTSPEDGLRIWDLMTGQSVMTHAGEYASGLAALTFDPTGTLLAVSPVRGRNPTSVLVVEAATGRERWALTGLRSEPSHLAFSPDGRRLAATSGRSNVHGGEVVLWDLATGQEVLTLAAAGLHGQVAFSPEGWRLCQVALSPESRQLVIEDWNATPLAEEPLRK